MTLKNTSVKQETYENILREENNILSPCCFCLHTVHARSKYTAISPLLSLQKEKKRRKRKAKKNVLDTEFTEPEDFVF